MVYHIFFYNDFAATILYLCQREPTKSDSGGDLFDFLFYKAKPMNSSNNDLVALQETLYTSKNPTRRWLHNTRRNWINEAVKKHTCSLMGPRSLEVGPGGGGYLPLLAEVSFSVLAADIEIEYLQHAEKIAEGINKLDCIIDDITRTNLPAGKFDLVLCTEVIEHIEDSQAALNGLRTLLAENGRLVLSTPQRYSPLEICAKIAFLPGIITLVRQIYREPIIPTGHINLLTEKQLKKQFLHSDFIIVEEYKCGFYLPIIAEMFGGLGLRFEQWAEKKIRGSIFSGLLWTQCYVLKGK
jgi:SAM-dependent methyltransferase